MNYYLSIYKFNPYQSHTLMLEGLGKILIPIPIKTRKTHGPVSALDVRKLIYSELVFVT